MVVAFDGESKCGKTTAINAVATEAAYQTSVVPGLPDEPNSLAALCNERGRTRLRDLRHSLTFNRITTVSAGNMFRAATFYVLAGEREGRQREAFGPDDVDRLRGLLSSEGIYDVLQKDEAIGKRVSSVAQMAGVQALCGAIFSDAVVHAYHEDAGPNLVIVDARNPVGTLQRNGVIGTGSRQIDPASILPVYIDTPTEVAASRMGGIYEDRLAEVSMRRHLDVTRPELPVRPPEFVIHDYAEWEAQFSTPVSGGDVALPLHVDNGEAMSLVHLQQLAGHIAVVAQEAAFYLNNHKQLIGAEV